MDPDSWPPYRYLSPIATSTGKYSQMQGSSWLGPSTAESNLDCSSDSSKSVRGQNQLKNQHKAKVGEKACSEQSWSGFKNQSQRLDKYKTGRKLLKCLCNFFCQGSVSKKQVQCLGFVCKITKKVSSSTHPETWKTKYLPQAPMKGSTFFTFKHLSDDRTLCIKRRGNSFNLGNQKNSQSRVKHYSYTPSGPLPAILVVVFCLGFPTSQYKPPVNVCLCDTSLFSLSPWKQPTYSWLPGTTEVLQSRDAFGKVHIEPWLSFSKWTSWCLCPQSKLFWKKVGDMGREITGHQFSDNHSVFLLNLPKNSGTCEGQKSSHCENYNCKNLQEKWHLLKSLTGLQKIGKF